MCTTVSTIPTHAYSLKNNPIKIDQKSVQQKCIATITSMSEEAGVELVMNFNRSVDKPKFIIWLRALRKLHPKEKLACFMDRLSVHRSNDVADEMHKLGIIRILNGSYR